MERRETRAADTKRFAYAFYATDYTYAIAALTLVKRLRQLHARQDADMVVLHTALPAHLLNRMRALGVVTRRVRAPAKLRGHYRDCLTKLLVFQLVDYERVVYVDADAIPLKSLDFLFTFQFDAPVAAARAYWLPQPFWTTYLLVVKPSLELWKRVNRWMGSETASLKNDMDIINLEFGGEIQTLPAGVTCLDSEWEDARRPGFFPDAAGRFSAVALVHFTALGKPWSYSVARGRRLRPHAHEAFHELREEWWTVRDAAFQDSPPLAAACYQATKLWCQCVNLKRLTDEVGRTMADLSSAEPGRNRPEGRGGQNPDPLVQGRVSSCQGR